MEGDTDYPLKSPTLKELEAKNHLELEKIRIDNIKKIQLHRSTARLLSDLQQGKTARGINDEALRASQRALLGTGDLTMPLNANIVGSGGSLARHRSRSSSLTMDDAVHHSKSSSRHQNPIMKSAVNGPQHFSCRRQVRPERSSSNREIDGASTRQVIRRHHYSEKSSPAHRRIRTEQSGVEVKQEDSSSGESSSVGESSSDESREFDFRFKQEDMSSDERDPKSSSLEDPNQTQSQDRNPQDYAILNNPDGPAKLYKMAEKGDKYTVFQKLDGTLALYRKVDTAGITPENYMRMINEQAGTVIGKAEDPRNLLSTEQVTLPETVQNAFKEAWKMYPMDVRIPLHNVYCPDSLGIKDIRKITTFRRKLEARRQRRWKRYHTAANALDKLTQVKRRYRAEYDDELEEHRRKVFRKVKTDATQRMKDLIIVSAGVDHLDKVLAANLERSWQWFRKVL